MKKNEIKRSKGIGSSFPYFILAAVLAAIVTIFINI